MRENSKLHYRQMGEAGDGNEVGHGAGVGEGDDGNWGGASGP